MGLKAREARDYPILKVKLGTPHDLQIMRAIRQATDKPIYVDANTAWTPKTAVRKIRDLVPYGIEFIEQPTRADDLEGLRFVREHVDVPIIADESVKRADDIPSLLGCVDGINIKLTKCGGLLEAVRMIHVARTHGLQVMIGLHDREFAWHHGRLHTSRRSSITPTLTAIFSLRTTPIAA